MALLLTSHPSLLSKNPKLVYLRPSNQNTSLPLSLLPNKLKLKLSPLRSSVPPTTPGWTPADDDNKSDSSPTIVDEWGEKSEQETEPLTKLSAADPPQNEDEWGDRSEFVVSGNGSAGFEVRGESESINTKAEDLKRCLVDTVYGSDLGFRASAEERAEVLELVSQLEGLNPTPAPMDAIDILDGNWVLLYTAFSELLPLLAVGTIPLLKVDKICQVINTSNLSIDNCVTVSSPLATLSFSATANFEVRSPSRIQVEFKEGTLRPPEIKSYINLPENLDFFGQKINLSAVQQSLNPLQEGVEGIARVISGQAPLKIPIAGERSKSWLLTTYLDKDLRISRGDGGLFVLAKEGSPLLYQ